MRKAGVRSREGNERESEGGRDGGYRTRVGKEEMNREEMRKGGGAMEEYE